MDSKLKPPFACGHGKRGFSSTQPPLTLYLAFLGHKGSYTNKWISRCLTVFDLSPHHLAIACILLLEIELRLPTTHSLVVFYHTLVFESPQQGFYSIHLLPESDLMTLSIPFTGVKDPW